MNNVEKLLEESITTLEKREEFIAALLNSNVYVMATEQENEGPDGKKMLNMITVQNQDGKKCVPFFTSIARLMFFAENMANGEPPHVELKCKDFLAAVAQTGCILNPNSQTSKLFTPKDIAEIVGVQGPTPLEMAFQNGERVSVGQPGLYPQELTDHLTEFFESREDVSRAWVFQIGYGKTLPHILLVIEPDDQEQDVKMLFAAVGRTAQGHMRSKEDGLDILSSNHPFVQQFLAKGLPFFDKRADGSEESDQESEEE